MENSSAKWPKLRGARQFHGAPCSEGPIDRGQIDIVVVYKVDRLTRSLSDFTKLVDVFDGQKVSFVSVTQQFNTTSSMGRLTLDMLLSFAQFEREVTGERIRDKFQPLNVRECGWVDVHPWALISRIASS